MMRNSESLTMNIPNTHKQEEIVLREGDNEIRFKCDNLIAPLIVKLNEAGLKTQYCCSGHEDEAFATMYIQFKPTTSKNDIVDRVYDLVDKTGDYFALEFEYKLRSVSSNYHETRIFLVNPTIDELRLAVKLCVGVDFEEVFQVDEKGRIKPTGRFEKAIKQVIVLRSCIPDDKISEEYIEENYKFVMDGINTMMSLL